MIEFEKKIKKTVRKEFFSALKNNDAERIENVINTLCETLAVCLVVGGNYENSFVDDLTMLAEEYIKDEISRLILDVEMNEV